MASYDKMKVKVGQRWGKSSYGWKLIISRVDGKLAYYKFCDKDGKVAETDREQSADLKDDGTLQGWDDGWVIEKDAAPATLIDFFKAVPDGHCPCNIPKEQCGYHKA
jgi:hypothetical protein